MFSVYVIQNDVSKETYIGKTNDLKCRLCEHHSGEQTAAHRKEGQWILIYAEAYREKFDADWREQALKQYGSNKRWLFDRISDSLLAG